MLKTSVRKLIASLSILATVTACSGGGGTSGTGGSAGTALPEGGGTGGNAGTGGSGGTGGSAGKGGTAGNAGSGGSSDKDSGHDDVDRPDHDAGIPDVSVPDGTVHGFESDDPNKGSSQTTGGLDAGSSADSGGGPVPPPPPGGDPTRAIIEADIIQIRGDTLYALSEYGGLSVIDIANVADLKMLGRFSIRARPFEMYLRDGVAYAMYSSFPHYERDASGAYRYIVTSRIVAIDVTKPAAMKEIGTFDLPGDVSDSRMVGDVVYVVTYENGSCWGCTANQPRSVVTSIAAGDPANVHKVEQLAFNDSQNVYGWYRRSIHVTTDRLYVSGMTYDGTWGNGTGHSTIQVVDISDPTGKLVPGAQVTVAGQIESRWQMDELSGVLRVISQSGTSWSNGPPPVLQTFTVQSAQSIVPLGSLTLTLPRVENLKSVRFDGTRAYAVTFEQKDPLFTLDLQDPAAPKQVGEVEMPGFLHHMEPRGDRLIALGIDNGNAGGGLTVSIFDVADLAHPTLLSRANFGGSWGGLPEDQDRIHKAFRIFDAEGLIAMPFSGWVSSTPDGGWQCSRYTSGVQLFDFSRDQVVARGIAPLRGEARRAFLHRDTLFAVSDDQVASFNIDDRSAPAPRGKLSLTNIADKTVRVGNYLVELGTDWWTSEPILSVLPIDSQNQGVPVATFDLASAIRTEPNTCYTSYWGAFTRNAQLFVEGSTVYVAYDAGFTGTNGRGRMGFAVIDMADPIHPVLRGSKLLDVVQSSQQQPWYVGGYYGCGVGYYTNPTGVWSSGERIVKVGTSLVVQELRPVDLPGMDAGSSSFYAKPTQAILHAVDLSDPTNIRLASSSAIADGQSASGIFADGKRVVTSHQEDVAQAPGRTRFFVDRVDFTNPAAPTRTKINVPGSLLGLDGSDRAVTVDYRRMVTHYDVDAGTSPPWNECQITSGFGTAWWVYGPPTWRYESCIRVFRTLKLVSLGESEATLLDAYEPQGDVVSDVQMGSDRLWIRRNRYVPSTPTKFDDGGIIWSGGDYNEAQVDTLAGLRAGHFELGSVTKKRGYTMIPERSGKRFAIIGNENPGRVTVFDTADPTAVREVFEWADAPFGNYGGSALTFDGPYLIWSMGKYGATAIPLP